MKEFLRTLILVVVRLFGLPSARTAAQHPESTPPRILLLRPDHLGDLILTTPILDALKTHIHDAHITMMVGPWSSEVIARHPAVDCLLTCPFPGFQRAAQKSLAPYILLLNIAQQLRRDKYDLAINLRPDFWWGAGLLYLAGIPHRVGYALEPGRPFLTRALPFNPPEPAPVSNLRLVSAAMEALDYSPLEQPYTPEHYPLQFIPTAEEEAWVSERLDKEGIRTDAPIVVIHPGSGAAVKLWRTEAWSTCADMLPALFTTSKPVRIILTGSESERPMLEEISQGMTVQPVLVTDANVGQLAAILKRAQMVLGVDSGPLHLAVAQRTPTVHIFGPTDPHIFGPWGADRQHIVIASTQRCPTCPNIPCGRLDFRASEVAAHPCVRLIPEQQVEAAVTTMLKKEATPPINTI